MSEPPLTSEQVAVLESTARITVVRAGPGSGKTRVFVEVLREALKSWSQRKRWNRRDFVYKRSPERHSRSCWWPLEPASLCRHARCFSASVRRTAICPPVRRDGQGRPSYPGTASRRAPVSRHCVWARCKRSDVSLPSAIQPRYGIVPNDDVLHSMGNERKPV